MKRVLATVVPLLALLPVLYAAAAGLNVNGGVLQAGGDTVRGCDQQGVTVSYTVVFASGAFRVITATVSNIAQGCSSKNLALQFTNAQGGPVGSTQTISITHGSSNSPCTMDSSKPQDSRLTCQVGFGSNGPLADQISDVHIAIYTKP